MVFAQAALDTALSRVVPWIASTCSRSPGPPLRDRMISMPGRALWYLVVICPACSYLIEKPGWSAIFATVCPNCSTGLDITNRPPPMPQ